MSKPLTFRCSEQSTLRRDGRCPQELTVETGEPMAGDALVEAVTAAGWAWESERDQASAEAGSAESEVYCPTHNMMAVTE